MSQTALMALNLELPGNDQADGDVQLNYTISAGENNSSYMDAGATLTYQVNEHSHPHIIATTPSDVDGVPDGTDNVYTVGQFDVTEFSLPANGIYHGGKFDGVSFVLTVDASGNGTLSGVFFACDEKKKPSLGGDNLSWTADDEPFPKGGKHKGASGKH
jgi:hypothetical protein